MGQIRILPNEVVQRIAAGEVIDRPAAVVKELIENAIDAGAANIRIDVEGDGLDLVRVVDDGVGIAQSDIELAFARHATSKLMDFEDIHSISTLGFRGEALASIASVAEITIETKSAGTELGVMATAKSGRTVKRSPVVRHRGTSVSVRDLFADLPARRALAVGQPARREFIRVVRHYAFATPHVGFLLRVDGQEALKTSVVSNPAQLLSALYGPGIERLSAAIQDGENAVVSGFVSISSLSRPTREHIHLSINGRPVANRQLLEAIESGYRAYFPRGRHPIAAIRVVSPPSHIDPNIHPAKHEVRLRDEQSLRSTIAGAVRSALEASVSRPGGRQDLSPVRLLVDMRPMASAPPTPGGQSDRLRLKAIASSSRGVLFAEGPGGIYLVDHHRAHERLIYNRFRGHYRRHKVVPEQLVEPVVIELASPQAKRLSSRMEELVEAGFECEPFGGRSFIVRTAPSSLLHDAISDSLSESLATDDENWLDRLLVGLSCRSAVRKGVALPSGEQEALIDGLCGSESPTVCPHGSPIILQLDDTFLRRQFGW